MAGAGDSTLRGSTRSPTPPITSPKRKPLSMAEKVQRISFKYSSPSDSGVLKRVTQIEVSAWVVKTINNISSYNILGSSTMKVCTERMMMASKRSDGERGVHSERDERFRIHTAALPPFEHPLRRQPTCDISAKHSLGCDGVNSTDSVSIFVVPRSTGSVALLATTSTWVLSDVTVVRRRRPVE
ncbi:hypothetical protein QJS10_CPB17g01218 [Acorus calamus]|uniref:Uncharacterized protein n=1 Tax=Acorus calamus TaxID=4465 RepID=A0AAV9CT88_ACOCL|nr:hypothetical protein QJS10_CPB17g01218 [Acorus calamus]